MSASRNFKLLLLFFFIFLVILTVLGGCERDRENETPRPDPEPGQQQEEMVQEERDEPAAEELETPEIVEKIDETGKNEESKDVIEAGEAGESGEAGDAGEVGEVGETGEARESGQAREDREVREVEEDKKAIETGEVDEVIEAEEVGEVRETGEDNEVEKAGEAQDAGEDPLGLEPGQAVRSARLTLYSEDGSTRWEVQSEEAVRRERAAEISMQPVVVDSFLDENGGFSGETAYDLRGEEGLYLEDDQVLTLKGDARLESRELLFRSSNISWEQRDNLIFSRERTTIEGKKFTASGQGFEAEADLSKFHLQGSEREKARIVWEGSIDERENF